jgi:hypothetical protein
MIDEGVTPKTQRTHDIESSPEPAAWFHLHRATPSSHGRGCEGLSRIGNEFPHTSHLERWRRVACANEEEETDGSTS